MRRTKIMTLCCLMALTLSPWASGSEPSVDPKRIINESNSFLRDREPEMTQEEYALYEKVLLMLSANPEFASKLLESMMTDKDLPSPAFEFILGNAYYAAGHTELSEKRYRSAVTRYPSFLRAWVNLGILYYSTERYREAIPCFSKAITLGDRDSSTFGLMGYCIEKEGNFVSAEMAYMQALSGDPDNPDWKEGLLRICVNGKQYARAESLVKNLIAERPTEAGFWLIYANILIGEGRKVDATVLMEAASGLGKANTEELSLLGDLYSDLGLVPETISTFKRVLDQSVELGEPKMLHFAKALISVGKLQEAQGVLDALEPKLTPTGKLEFLQSKSDILAAQEKWPEARKELEQLLSIAPLNGRALLSMGRIYVQQDDTARASFTFEEAAKIDDAAYVADLELANLELKARHYAKCVDFLEKALTLQRSDAVEDYLARVKTLVVKEDPPQL